MADDRGFDMLVAVVGDGEAELVMQAAKEAGANGGTIISARGTGSPNSKKDIVLILTSSAKRQGILQAISFGADLNSDGRGIAFSVPVDDVVGIISI
ncbi:MAG: P-II family nitrogen regulator [Christensenellaceae bacterium]|nr:P-II family nitrogen regulator [Christensenellaceae bacterium]MBR3843244.1 P-II family nitrogen regulator [Christensenellaceae bacterium]